MKTFPILASKEYGGLRSIPWDMIAPQEAAAKYNHGGQSLEELAARGGLDVFETLAVLAGRKRLDRNYTRGEADAELARLVRAYVETHATHIIDALIPAARLVYEQGGWSGTSGNWPLVEAFDKLEALKALAPEVHARISEKLPTKEYTDEPCTLCNGTGKSPGKTVGELESDGFAQGKNMAEFIYERQLAKVKAFLEETSKETATYESQSIPGVFGENPTRAAWKARELLGQLPENINPCKCPEIQAKDPRRHFKECPERKPLPEQTKESEALHDLLLKCSWYISDNNPGESGKKLVAKIDELVAAPAKHCGVEGWAGSGCTKDENCTCACNGCLGVRVAKAEQELAEGKSKPLEEVFSKERK